jgi:hypothetical protein
MPPMYDSPINWIAIGVPASGVLLSGYRIRGRISSAIRQVDKMVEIQTPVGTRVWVTLESLERVDLPTMQDITDSFKGMAFGTDVMGQVLAALAPGRELLDHNGCPNEIHRSYVNQTGPASFEAVITFLYVDLGKITITFDEAPAPSLRDRMDRLAAMGAQDVVVTTEDPR